MKTVAELQARLQKYREKEVDFPTYDDLIELTEAVADYMAEAKEREAKLIKAGMFYVESLAEVQDFEDAEKLLYEKAGLEELK